MPKSRSATTIESLPIPANSLPSGNLEMCSAQLSHLGIDLAAALEQGLVPMSASSDHLSVLIEAYKTRFDNYPPPSEAKDFSPPFPKGFAAKYYADDLLTAGLQQALDKGEPMDFKQFSVEVLKRWAA